MPRAGRFQVNVWLLAGFGALVVAAVVVAVALLARGSGGTGVRIYDPAGGTKDEVRTADIVKSSVQVTGVSGTWLLGFQLTPDGAREFHRLTRSLAQRGAQAGHPQPFAFEVDGHVYARPAVDYHFSPDGLSSSSGLEISGLRCDLAQRLAVKMRKPLFTPEQTGCLPAAAPRTAAGPAAKAVAAGGSHTCALTASGQAECWGANTFGELGRGASTGPATPNATARGVVGLPRGVQVIVAGANHTCSLTDPGKVECWGSNQYGQLGGAKKALQGAHVPAFVVGLGKARAVTAGDGHTCAVTVAAGVSCWGLNGNGQLGDGTTVDRGSAVAVRGLAGVRAIDAGGLHTCAVTDAGAVECWGFNRFGQLGDGTTVDRPTPVRVEGLPGGVLAVAAGGLHTCALTRARTVECWGFGKTGQLGNGSTKGRLAPVPVRGLRDVRAIAAGDSYTCALMASGRVECWGWNANGQLGDGTTRTRLTPVPVFGLRGVAAIATAASHTCALTTGGHLECWGANVYGQLGDGTNRDRHRAVTVSGFGSASG
jgi:alpha-tubulin suppressor-like RCC1 family protein